MASVDFTVQMIDKVSAPAKKAAASVDKITKATKKTTASAKKAAKASESLGAQLMKATVGGDLVASAIKKVASFALEAAKAVARLALRFGMAVGKAAQFGEALQFSLTKFLKSSSRAKTEIAAEMKISNKLGLDFHTTAENFIELVSAGFVPAAAKDMLKLKADLLAMGTGSAESSEKINSAFGHIQKAMAKGKIEADGFNEILGNLPVTKMQIMGKLAKLMGKDVSALMKMDITKLPVDKLMTAIQQATLAAANASELGETALNKQKEPVGGMMNLSTPRVGTVPDRLAHTRGGSGFLDVLDDIAKGMESEEFQAAIDDIAASLTSLSRAAIAIFKIASGAAKGMAKAWANVSEPLNRLNKSLGGVETEFDWVDALSMAFQGLGYAAMIVIGPLLQVWAAIKAVGRMIGIVVDQITAAKAKFATAASEIGSGVINSLTGGILAKGSKVASAMASVARSAVAAARSVLDFGSPSKVFEHMGAMSALGFAQGIEGGAPKIGAMSAGAVAPSVGGGGATINQSNSSTFNVTEAQSAEETARMVKKMQLLEKASAFEQMAIEIAG